jgi:hypothetical protein
VTPVRVPPGRVALAVAVVVTLEAGLLGLGVSGRTVLALGSATVGLAAALVFCLGAVTVAGFATGVAAAALMLVLGTGLLPVLAGALVVALGCGVAPGWRRVEAWQAARNGSAVAGAADGAVLWRTDRVLAAFLVLAFPPLVTVGALAFAAWSTTR